MSEDTGNSQSSFCPERMPVGLLSLLGVVSPVVVTAVIIARLGEFRTLSHLHHQSSPVGY